MSSRIRLEMTQMDAIVAMCEGNPGAGVACAEIMRTAETIDQDAALGGIGIILSFDDMGIYGSRIWMLFKDVCGQDTVKLLAILRARQLGGLAGISEAKINHAIDNCGEGIDHEEVLKAVKKELPKFNAQPVSS